MATVFISAFMSVLRVQLRASASQSVRFSLVGGQRVPTGGHGAESEERTRGIKGDASSDIGNPIQSLGGTIRWRRCAGEASRHPVQLISQRAIDDWVVAKTGVHLALDCAASGTEALKNLLPG